MEQYGYNEIPKTELPFTRIYLAPLFNYFIVILIASAILITLLGEWDSAILTYAIVGMNSSVAMFQQYRTRKTIKSLEQFVAPKATFLEKGKQREIDSGGLVPGDIILLFRGNKIPADGRIIESLNLMVNEASLTGESVSVEKNELTLPKKPLPIQNQSNMVFMGTHVTTGWAKVLVTTTGSNTEIGKISTELREMSPSDIPITRKMNKVAKILAVLLATVLIITVWYKVYVFLSYNQDQSFLVIFNGLRINFVDALAIAMNAVPVNLPLLTTIILISGVFNLAKSGVIIRNFSVIEALGRVSIVCSDKTGTITQNNMTVQKVWFDGNLYRVSGSGYYSRGRIYENGEKLDLKPKPHLQLMLTSGVVNNNTTISERRVPVKVKGQKYKVIRTANGNPTEAALLVLAEKAGLKSTDLRKKYKRMKEFEFDQTLKLMTSICKGPGGKVQAFTKGATEIVLKKSVSIASNKKILPLEQAQKKNILNEVSKQAELGYRILALGFRQLDSKDIKSKGKRKKDEVTPKKIKEIKKTKEKKKLKKVKKAKKGKEIKKLKHTKKAKDSKKAKKSKKVKKAKKSRKVSKSLPTIEVAAELALNPTDKDNMKDYENKPQKKELDHLRRNSIERDLVFLGFVMIVDPPREGVREAVESVESAGISVAMITGDHPKTAKAIAEQMAIHDPGDKVIQGKDIRKLNHENFLKTSVFSRVSPADKELIVKRYKEDNRVVAMTGDGINDALALKDADTGIAMGIGGSDVAKDTSDIILSDDNFASIVSGLRVGRGIYFRIRIIFYFFICINLVEGLVFFGLAFVPNLIAFTSIQHIYFILAVHSLPSIVLAFDPFPKDIMNEPPRDNEELINKNTLFMMAIHASLLGLGFFLAFIYPFFTFIPFLGPDQFFNLNPALTVFDPSGLYALQKARTTCITVMFISECAMIWSIRRPNKSVLVSMREEFNPWLMIVIILVLFAQVGLILFGWLIQPILGLTGFINLYWMFLNPLDWLIIIGLSFLSIVGLELFKRWARRRGMKF